MAKTDQTVSPQIIWVIVGTGILAFTGILTETSMNVTFPDLMKQFNISLSVVQWLTTAYLLMVSLVMTTSAFLKAKFNPRQIFIIAIVAFLIGDIVAIMSHSFALLLVGRVIQGIGTGVITPLVFNIILENVPMAHIGKYMGFGTMILSLAPAFGPIFGGVVAYYLGWREIFLLVLPVAFVSLVISIKTVPTEHIKNDAFRFDYVSFAMLAIAFTSFLWALSQLEHGHVSGMPFGLLIVAAFAFAGFLYRAKHATRQFLNLGIFRVPALRFAMLGYVAYMFTNLMVNFAVPTFVQLSLGATTMIAGFALMPGSLAGALLNPIYGRAYDVYGPKMPLLAGNAAFVVIIMVWSMMTMNGTVISMTIFYLLMTLGRNLAFGTSMTAGLAQLSLPERADGNAIFNTAQQFAGAIGTTVASLLMKVNPDSAASVATQTARGAQHVFGFMLALGVLNFV
ncbi:MFS transporter [Weissella cibaria]|uniref:MFS transporter n=1 Tax=Weissella cibaria TaxID=137591 RepID=UPI002A74FE86|nr:MFS transporter [Weissella cibaria]MDY2519239.1 MFS transporter [Weissella cibaria]